MALAPLGEIALRTVGGGGMKMGRMCSRAGCREKMHGSRLFCTPHFRELAPEVQARMKGEPWIDGVPR